MSTCDLKKPDGEEYIWDAVRADILCGFLEGKRTHVEFIQLRPHTLLRHPFPRVRQQNLSNGVNDAELVGAEVG